MCIYSNKMNLRDPGLCPYRAKQRVHCNVQPLSYIHLYYLCFLTDTFAARNEEKYLYFQVLRFMWLTTPRKGLVVGDWPKAVALHGHSTGSLYHSAPLWYTFALLLIPLLPGMKKHTCTFRYGVACDLLPPRKIPVLGDWLKAVSLHGYSQRCILA